MSMIIYPIFPFYTESYGSISCQQVCSIFGNQKIIAIKDIIFYVINNARSPIIRNVARFSFCPCYSFSLGITIDTYFIHFLPLNILPPPHYRMRAACHDSTRIVACDNLALLLIPLLAK